jgi:hypothetical protein
MWSLADRNTQELCKKAYARISMLTKLKYVGVSIDDLIEVYVLFIRSLVEYCSVLWHSRLTQELVYDLQRVQKICLQIILRENYVSYEAALEMCGLAPLYERRENRCLHFAERCLKHPKFKHLFPLSEPDEHNIRQGEKYHVNFERTGQYMNSTIPYLQRKLNSEHRK